MADQMHTCNYHNLPNYGTNIELIPRNVRDGLKIVKAKQIRGISSSTLCHEESSNGNKSDNRAKGAREGDGSTSVAGNWRIGGTGCRRQSKEKKRREWNLRGILWRDNSSARSDWTLGARDNGDD